MSKENPFNSHEWGKKLDAHDTDDSLLNLAEALRQTESVNYTLPSKARQQIRQKLKQQVSATSRPFFIPRLVIPAVATVFAVLLVVLMINGRSSLPLNKEPDAIVSLNPVLAPPTVSLPATGNATWPTPTPTPQVMPTTSVLNTTTFTGTLHYRSYSDHGSIQPFNSSEGYFEDNYIVPPSESFFENYGVNPWVETSSDALSTFGLEVDSAAYTLMRRYITEGRMPSPDSVRVEEYINYFDANYPQPDISDFNIVLEGAPHPYRQQDNTYLVRVGVQGYDVPKEERPPALLIFVIDTSGSMEGENRLGLVKDSLRLLVDELNPTDRIGIVTYGSTVETVLEPTSIEQRAIVLQTIHSLQSTGVTNMEDGLRVAYEMAETYRQSGQINRLILASDGVANVGRTTAETLIPLYAQNGVSLSTFGFGLGNYNDVLMEQLANQGDGTYGYIDTITEAKRLFVDDLTGTIFTIAKDAKTQVAFNPETVTTYRLLGYENRDIADEDFRNDTVDAGEIGAGHNATALYEITLADDVPTDAILFTASIRYTHPETNDVYEINRAFGLSGLADSFTNTTPSFQLTAVVAEFAEILRGSDWVSDNNLVNLSEEAQRVASLLPTNNDAQEFAWLVQQASHLHNIED